MSTLTLFSPAGAPASGHALRRAAKRLTAWGFEVSIDADALTRDQRFAGPMPRRLAVSIALPKRCRMWPWPRAAVWLHAPARSAQLEGYCAQHRARHALGGLQRLHWLPERPDCPCQGLGHLVRPAGVQRLPGAARPKVAWTTSPRTASRRPCPVPWRPWASASQGAARGIQPFDGLRRVPLWGGNLTVLCALLGTPHFPRVKGGVLFLGGRTSRSHRAHAAAVAAGRRDRRAGGGVARRFQRLDAPEHRSGLRPLATPWRLCAREPAPRADRTAHWPLRHQVCLPVGAKVDLFVQGREVILGWQSDHRLAHRHAHRYRPTPTDVVVPQGLRRAGAAS